MCNMTETRTRDPRITVPRLYQQSYPDAYTSSSLISEQFCIMTYSPAIFKFALVNVFNASEELIFQIFIHHNSMCQVLCGSRKRLPRTSLQCCYIFLAFFRHFGVIESGTFKCWKLSTDEAGARGDARFHYPSCKDLIKPDNFFPDFLIHHNSRCQVLYSSRKKLFRTLLQCCYILLVLWDSWVLHFLVLRIKNLSSRY
jgi:hypothetical protein